MHPAGLSHFPLSSNTGSIVEMHLEKKKSRDKQGGKDQQKMKVDTRILPN